MAKKNIWLVPLSISLALLAMSIPHIIQVAQENSTLLRVSASVIDQRVAGSGLTSTPYAHFRTFSFYVVPTHAADPGQKSVELRVGVSESPEPAFPGYEIGETATMYANLCAYGVIDISCSTSQLYPGLSFEALGSLLELVIVITLAIFMALAAAAIAMYEARASIHPALVTIDEET